jgi:hypothetical protein
MYVYIYIYREREREREKERERERMSPRLMMLMAMGFMGFVLLSRVGKCRFMVLACPKGTINFSLCHDACPLHSIQDLKCF